MENLNNLWDRIGSTSKESVRIAVLKDEIENAKAHLQPHDTGHLYDYISRLNERLTELND